MTEVKEVRRCCLLHGLEYVSGSICAGRCFTVRLARGSPPFLSWTAFQGSLVRLRHLCFPHHPTARSSLIGMDMMPHDYIEEEASSTRGGTISSVCTGCFQEASRGIDFTAVGVLLNHLAGPLYPCESTVKLPGGGHLLPPQASTAVGGSTTWWRAMVLGLGCVGSAEVIERSHAPLNPLSELDSSTAEMGCRRCCLEKGGG